MKRVTIILLIIELIVSTAGWMLIFTFTNWEVGLGIFLLMLGNNLMIARRMAKNGHKY